MCVHMLCYTCYESYSGTCVPEPQPHHNHRSQITARRCTKYEGTCIPGYLCTDRCTLSSVASWPWTMPPQMGLDTCTIPGTRYNFLAAFSVHTSFSSFSSFSPSSCAVSPSFCSPPPSSSPSPSTLSNSFCFFFNKSNVIALVNL